MSRQCLASGSRRNPFGPQFKKTAAAAARAEDDKCSRGAGGVVIRLLRIAVAPLKVSSITCARSDDLTSTGPLDMDGATRRQQPPSSNSGGEPTVIPASRRPDGSMRKEIRVRPGYVPQDEVARYSNSRLDAAKRVNLPAGVVPGMSTAAASRSAESAKATRNGEGSAAPRRQPAQQQQKQKQQQQQQKQQPQRQQDGSKATTTAPANGPSGASTSTVASGATAESVPVMEQRLKNLGRKLRAIRELAEKDIGSLPPEQKEKIARRPAIEAEMAELEAAIERLKT
ncbi:hypothetical protein HK405_015607 [Cladochytrium tenue]|nr:hypothetical protein HK405_015607 [Cladochytrium tenue]